MHKTWTAVALALSAAGLTAAPAVTGVSLHQHGSCAIVKYSLSESAIVTVDILTNGVSVGRHKLQSVSGDVNRMVDAGERMFRWNVASAFPEQSLANVTAEVTAWAQGMTPSYRVVSLSGDMNVRYYCDSSEIPDGVTNLVYKTEKLVMRRIPARNVPFRMGNRPRTRPDPSFVAVLTNDFWIGVYELTQRQHELVIGEKRGCAETLAAADVDIRPVECISYSYAVGGQHDEYKRNYQSFGVNSLLKKFQAKTGLPTLAFPTEAQWEFACRAGSGRDYPGAGLADPSDGAEISSCVGRYAWYAGNSGGHTHAVGLKEPNAFGLYDMIGNAQEIVYDWYDELKQVTYAGIVIDPFIAARDTGYGSILRRGACFRSQVADCKNHKRVYAGAWNLPAYEETTDSELMMQSGIRLAAVIW